MTGVDGEARGASVAAPRVTVLMSVYNGERYLPEAIASILDQTFRDFEFVIIDDGSTDASRAVIEGYKDPRIRLVTQENRGLAPSLNKGLRFARGEYVARQDADDVSLSERLERQVAYLDAHPGVALLGCNYTIIDSAGSTLATTRLFTHPDDLAVIEILSNQFGHGSVMMRKADVESVGGYNESMGYVEDYDLWIRISRVAQIANLNEPLYLWRRSENGISMSNLEHQEEQALAIRDREFEWLRKHPRQLTFLACWHPSSYRTGARVYFDRKAAVYRDLAYLYRRGGCPGRAALCLLVAAVVGPGMRSQGIRLLLRHVKYRSIEPVWPYEWVV